LNRPLPKNKGKQKKLLAIFKKKEESMQYFWNFFLFLNAKIENKRVTPPQA